MSSDMLSLIVAFFEWKEWTILRDPETGMVYTFFEGDNATWKLFALCHPERPILALYSLFPKTVPMNREAEIIQLITKINDGLIIGNFEYSFSHKEIKYRTSLDATGMPIDLKMCNSIAYYNLLAMDQYYRCFDACITAGLAAHESLQLLR